MGGFRKLFLEKWGVGFMKSPFQEKWDFRSGILEKWDFRSAPE